MGESSAPIFRMDMHRDDDHPDGDYQVVNKVAVLDAPRAIGWLTGYDEGDGHLEFGPDHLTNSLHHLAELTARRAGDR